MSDQFKTLEVQKMKVIIVEFSNRIDSDEVLILFPYFPTKYRCLEITLAHSSLETGKGVMGKQCRSRSDATVVSDQDLHCLLKK